MRGMNATYNYNIYLLYNYTVINALQSQLIAFNLSKKPVLKRRLMDASNIINAF